MNRRKTDPGPRSVSPDDVESRAAAHRRFMAEIHPFALDADVRAELLAARGLDRDAA